MKNLSKIFKILLVAMIVLLFQSNKSTAKLKVLIFSKTEGFHHASIVAGIVAIMKMGKENDFDVDTTTNSTLFTTDNLKQYAAVIFLNTTGDVLNYDQQAAFEKYIHSGGGFVGVHAATDTEYDWPWYGKLVGAYFKNHPKPQDAMLNVVERNFIATKNIPDQWKHFDEWYNFKYIADGLHILITIDEKSYTGGENGRFHPISWYHKYDGGRAFYTALGHTDECYTIDRLFLIHLLGGIKYAMGKRN